jgi:hypothetical protein
MASRAHQNESLFEGFEQELKAVTDFKFPRYLWANTTVRKPTEALPRILVLVENADELTVDRYPTAASWKAAAGALFAEAEGQDEPVTTDVVGKVMLGAEEWGLLSQVPRPAPGRSWIKVHPAGEAMVTDPDPIGLFAWLLDQHTFSDEHPIRGSIAVRRFLTECEAAGIASVRVDHVAFFMATASKEEGWKREVNRLLAHIAADPDRPVSAAQWVDLVDADGKGRASVANAVTELISRDHRTAEDVATSIVELAPRLLPRCKKRDRLTRVLTPFVLDGDSAAATAATIDLLVDKKLDSQYDMVRAHLRYMKHAELLEEVVGRSRGRPRGESRKHAGVRFQLTDFGRESLRYAPPPPKTASDARRDQRASTTTPFGERRKDRSARFASLLEADRTVDGRAALARALDWGLYTGRRVPHLYEWAAIRSIMALVTASDGHDMLEGVRTLLTHDFEARSHAPGGGPDTWFPTASGIDVLVEGSGESGRKLIKHELEPIVRHAVKHSRERSVEAAVLLVASEFEWGLMAYLLVDAIGYEKKGVPPVYVLPFRDEQIRRLLAVGAPIDTLLDEAIVLLKSAAKIRNQEAGDQFLTDLEHLVQDHCVKHTPTA